MKALYAKELGLKTTVSAPIKPQQKSWVMPVLGFALVAHVVGAYAYKAYKAK